MTETGPVTHVLVHFAGDVRIELFLDDKKLSDLIFRHEVECHGQFRCDSGANYDAFFRLEDVLYLEVKRKE